MATKIGTRNAGNFVENAVAHARDPFNSPKFLINLHLRRNKNAEMSSFLVPSIRPMPFEFWKANQPVFRVFSERLVCERHRGCGAQS